MTLTQAEARARLERLGRGDTAALDLAGTALLFAVIDAPDAPIGPVLAHLDEISFGARELGPIACGDSEAAAAGLASLLADTFGYRGDSETYDDPANANLIRVIARRRGLPVSLGILWIHAARAAGWRALGANMPAHFLVGIDAGSGPVIVDPFYGGVTLTLEQIGERLAEISPETDTFVLKPMPDRDVLLRLQNNVWQRRARAGDLAGAIACLEDMARLAPDEPFIWREAAKLHHEGGSLRGAIACLERLVALAPDREVEEGTRLLIEELRSRLN